MQPLPLEIHSVDAVRAIEARAIASGIAGYTLMSRAGECAAELCRETFPGARHWQVLCGPGNNGGDGYVLARAARAAGIEVEVVALADPASLAGDAARAWQDWRAAGGTTARWSGALAAGAELIVDALFGSGLARPLEGDYAAAVDAMNRHGAPVASLDIPSGIHGDSGERLGAAVNASLTITFVGLKSGLFLGDGLAAAGRLRFAGLALPPECRAAEKPVLRRIDENFLQTQLPARRRDAHKGDFGHVLVIGGGPGMPGAVRLCADAALRSGAGKVSVATHPDHAAIVGATRPELMPHAVADVRALGPLFDSADVIAFGSGLGRSDWARGLFAAVAGTRKPAVWDADALNLLAALPDDDRCDEQRILTPHPGEAARLLGLSAADVQRDRLAAVLRLQARFGAVAVLKGAGTLVAGPDGPPRVCTAGNPGMASGGMGDVLAGVIAALLAQGLTPADAAAAGVQAHAEAGDRAAAGGMRGLLASDLLTELRGVLNPRPVRGARSARSQERS